MQQGLWLISFLLITGGCILFAAGIFTAELRKSKAYYKGRAAAKVISLELLEETEGKGAAQYSNRYFPVIEYYAEGKLYSIRLGTGSYPSAYQIGDEIRIEYLEGSPDQFVIPERTYRYYLPLGLYCLGAGMIAVGAIIFIRFALGT